MVTRIIGLLTYRTHWSLCGSEPTTPSVGAVFSYQASTPRRPHFLRLRPSGCARPNCYLDPVVRFDFEGIVLAFCGTHAEDKAGGDTATILWVATGWLVCPLCYRALPLEIARCEHFNLAGRVCPPVAA